MFRFSIRDVLWLVALVAIVTAWRADRWQQNARTTALEEITHLDAQELFTGGWDAKVGAFRNQIGILKKQLSVLTHELESRGHRVEIIDGCNVFVDRPQQSMTIPTTHQAEPSN